MIYIKDLGLSYKRSLFVYVFEMHGSSLRLTYLLENFIIIPSFHKKIVTVMVALLRLYVSFESPLLQHHWLAPRIISFVQCVCYCFLMLSLLSVQIGDLANAILLRDMMHRPQRFSNQEVTACEQDALSNRPSQRSTLCHFMTVFATYAQRVFL